MTIITDTMNDMIIKSNNIAYDTFLHDSNNMEKAPSYKYLRINTHHALN